MAQPDSVTEVDSTVNPPSDETVKETTGEVQRETKNQRKRRERKESLPRDPVFSNPTDAKQEGKKTEPKPIDWRANVRMAKTWAPKLEGILDLYLSTRGAMQVVPQEGGALVIRGMTVKTYGEVPYYVDDKGEAVRGPLSEALAFHLIVLSDGTTKWIESFLKKHPQLVSFVAMSGLMIHLEWSIKANRAMIEEIEKRNAAQVQREYQQTRETEAIRVEPVE